MNKKLQYIAIFGMLGVCSALNATAAQKIPPQVARQSEVLVNKFSVKSDQELSFFWSDQRYTISNWPKALSNLKPQYITVLKTVHPAGPIERIDFRKKNEASPWLILTLKGSQATQLFQNISITEIKDGFLYLNLKDEIKRINLNEPVQLYDTNTQKKWTFILLETFFNKRMGESSNSRANWVVYLSE